MEEFDYTPNDAQRKCKMFLSNHPSKLEYTIKMPTGTGKSFLIRDIALENQCHRVILVFPRLALLSQFYSLYLSSQKHVDIAIECTEKDLEEKECTGQQLRLIKKLRKPSHRYHDKNHPRRIIVLRTYISYPNILEQYETFDCTIFDESHHCAEPKITKILQDPLMKQRCGTIYNFSATPEEINGEICHNH